MSGRGRLLLARRFLVLIALMFWQGGFTFYASVVVPTGQAVLESHLEQGYITRQVTSWLNLSGAVALVVLALDLVAAREAGWLRRLRWLLWLGMLGTLVALAWLHPHIDQYLNPQFHAVIDSAAFHTGHRAYLWVSTVQWGCALVYAWLTLRAWREADRV
ncbi:MAG TPA: hypothetical protein VKA46_12005 [Gemmataceae bacterium]|nr:hypothetical protein [Gemmataceae bacterium]